MDISRVSSRRNPPAILSTHSQFDRTKNEEQDAEKRVKRDDGYINLEQAFAKKGFPNANCECYIEINDKRVGVQTLSVLVPTKTERTDTHRLEVSPVSGSGLGRFCSDALSFETSNHDSRKMPCKRAMPRKLRMQPIIFASSKFSGGVLRNQIRARDM